jgi:hypothetical protein
MRLAPITTIDACQENGTGSDHDDRCLPGKWDWLRSGRSVPVRKMGLAPIRTIGACPIFMVIFMIPILAIQGVARRHKRRVRVVVSGMALATGPANGTGLAADSVKLCVA